MSQELTFYTYRSTPYWIKKKSKFLIQLGLDFHSGEMFTEVYVSVFSSPSYLKVFITDSNT
jgi:hypothetical protein